MASCDIICQGQEISGLFVNAKFGKPASIKLCAHNVVIGIMVDSQLEIREYTTHKQISDLHGQIFPVTPGLASANCCMCN